MAARMLTNPVDARTEEMRGEMVISVGQAHPPPEETRRNIGKYIGRRRASPEEGLLNKTFAIASPGNRSNKHSRGHFWGQFLHRRFGWPARKLRYASLEEGRFARAYDEKRGNFGNAEYLTSESPQPRWGEQPRNWIKFLKNPTDYRTSERRNIVSFLVRANPKMGRERREWEKKGII